MSDDPHFLHQRADLEAVLRPPIEGVRVLTWMGREERLIVATDEGELIEVDPVYGTRPLKGTVQDAAVLSSSPDGKYLLVVERGHALALHDGRTGERLHEQPTALLSDIGVVWFTARSGPAVAVVGQTLDGRIAQVTDLAFQARKRVKLPPKAVLGVNDRGKLVVARMLADGLDAQVFGKPMRAGTPSAHRLRFVGQGLLLGIAQAGVTVWRAQESNTVMVYDVTAADVHVAGGVVAVGTRSGNVAFASLEGGTLKRARPGKVGGHSGAVRELAFSRAGPWLASSADTVRIWRW